MEATEQTANEIVERITRFIDKTNRRAMTDVSAFGEKKRRQSSMYWKRTEHLVTRLMRHLDNIGESSQNLNLLFSAMWYQWYKVEMKIAHGLIWGRVNENNNTNDHAR